MDRRIQKSRRAIYQAFCSLLAQKSYSQITVQEIIDTADVGRSTFYAHYAVKEELLEEVCTQLFTHIFQYAPHPPFDGRSDRALSEALFSHIFDHIGRDGKMLMGILNGESQELFMEYFRGYMDELTERYLPCPAGVKPELYKNHVCVSFVGAMQWWFREGCRSSAEEMSRQFLSLLSPC